MLFLNNIITQGIIVGGVNPKRELITSSNILHLFLLILAFTNETMVFIQFSSNVTGYVYCIGEHEPDTTRALSSYYTFSARYIPAKLMITYSSTLISSFLTIFICLVALTINYLSLSECLLFYPLANYYLIWPVLIWSDCIIAAWWSIWVIIA